jgi:hypothetical protein
MIFFSAMALPFAAFCTITHVQNDIRIVENERSFVNQPRYAAKIPILVGAGHAGARTQVFRTREQYLDRGHGPLLHV